MVEEEMAAKGDSSGDRKLLKPIPDAQFVFLSCSSIPIFSRIAVVVREIFAEEVSLEHFTCPPS